MLQPLWESRDRYEELKQMDNAMKEVSRAAAGAGAAGPGHTARGALQIGARASHGGEGSVLGELTAWNTQNLGQSRCPVVAIAHGKCRASQRLGCLHPLRAAPWPRAGPSPPPGADLVQREGGGRDAAPGTGKATTWPQGYHAAAWHLEEGLGLAPGCCWD